MKYVEIFGEENKEFVWHASVVDGKANKTYVEWMFKTFKVNTDSFTSRPTD